MDSSLARAIENFDSTIYQVSSEDNFVLFFIEII